MPSRSSERAFQRCLQAVSRFFEPRGLLSTVLSLIEWKAWKFLYLQANSAIKLDLSKAIQFHLSIAMNVGLPYLAALQGLSRSLLEVGIKQLTDGLSSDGDIPPSVEAIVNQRFLS